MIKSLFDDDENGEKDVASAEQPLNSKEEPVTDAVEVEPEAKPDLESVVPFEVQSPIGRPLPEPTEAELERSIEEIEGDLLELGTPDDSRIAETEMKAPDKAPESPAAIPDVAPPDVFVEPVKITPKDVDHSSIDGPSSMAETMRKSGLAYSAAIALFGSVAFMLIMGWFADLVLGIGPWGTVIGIVIGAVIGFLQLFRITSKIIQPKPNDFDRVSLRSDLPTLNETDLSVPSIAEPAIPADGISDPLRQADSDEDSPTI